MSRGGPGVPPTIFSRDTGQTGQDAPKLNPFAALRHLNASRAAASRIASPLPPGLVGSSSGIASIAGTSIRAERRPLDIGDEKLAGTPPVKKAKVNNTIPVGSRLQSFLNLAPEAQRAMFAREARPSQPVNCPPRSSKDLPNDQPVNCSPRHLEDPPADQPIYRCFDCYHARFVCKDCVIRDHAHNPFHRIEVWTDAVGFWERISLGQLGFVLNLGHAGEKCPEQERLRKMTIVHEHGIIDMNVRFCNCVAKGDKFRIPEPMQLLRFGLFPGTWKEPHTAFTINGLRDYHLLSVQCQITGIDFTTYLQRCTDNVLSKDVTERHRELNDTMRQFTFLRSTRRAGQPPKTDLDSGSLAVLCPACPQPHKNMDPDQRREDSDSYLDMFFYTIDGNFQSAQKFKPMDKTDFPLTTGAASYAHEGDYEIYRAGLGPRRKERTTCRKFGAMGYSRYKGRVSGIVGLSCARHMFALPCGTVDITGGESFAYADYCMCAGLRPWLCLERHYRGYDVNCQYTPNLPERLGEINEKFHHLPTIQAKYFPWTMVGIGKFHVAAHQESCRSRYSYYYLPGSGMTDGEAPERIWSSLNNLSMRTKEMSSGHRHDVINDYYADMNVRRVHNMHNTLARRMERARAEEARTGQYLRELEENLPLGTLAKWRLEEAQWKENVEHLGQDGANFESPYELKKSQGICLGMSQKELLASLAKKGQLASESTASLLSVIERGIELQGEREALLDILEKDNRGSLREVTSRCDEFHAEVGRWQVLQEAYLEPLVESASASARATMEDKEIQPDFPLRDTTSEFRESESGDGLPRRRNVHGKTDSWKDVYDISIPLPSSYHRAVTKQPCMDQVCALEFDFRRASADEALRDVRAAIINREVIKIKRQDSQSKKVTERYDRRIGTANIEVTNHADHYRRHWIALDVLGKVLAKSDPRLRCLKEADVVKLDISTAQNLLGQSTQPVSWIWGDFGFVESIEDTRYQEFYDDVRRVHWFRSSAVHMRWEEEVRLLQEEMRRTLRFHTYYREQWEDCARQRAQTQGSGAAAYARKQAHRYERLIDACKKHFDGHIDLQEPSLHHALTDVQ